MAINVEEQGFIEKRQAILTQKFEAGNVSEIMKHYDDHSVDFSDHAWGALHHTRDQLISFLDATYTTVPGLRMVTHGVHGSKDFSVWEWTLKFVATEDDKVRGLEKGMEMWLRGASLHWWKVTDGGNEGELGDWRIWKEADYACPTEVGKE